MSEQLSLSQRRDSCDSISSGGTEKSKSKRTFTIKKKNLK